MKRTVIFTLILLFASSLYASTAPAAQEIYFSFEITAKSELEQLTRIVSIDNVKGNTVYAYANPKQLKKLSQMGYYYEIITKPTTHARDLTMAYTIAEMANWDRYPTYSVYIDMMYQFAADYPSICELENIGYSVNGKELLFIKISDNVSIEENEPEFMYTAQMHGDEIVTYIMMLRLIDYILTNYGSDAEITQLVNNAEIWINPLANPDGTYHVADTTVVGARRSNANGYDLNRNFPDPEDGSHPGGTWQPETIAMMDLAEEHTFVHSANLHSGAEVVNYPWDTWPRLHADDEWYQVISHEYADTVHAYAPSTYMDGFNNGITNGYAWYTINGGRQDYMNWFQACREVTLELNNPPKLLPSNQLPAHWNYNYHSFINYMENIFYGIRGVVTDTLGNPLDATITVVDHDFDNSEVFTDPDVGDYHRMLLPSVYDITVSSYGFIPQTISNITVVDTGATRVDVELQEAEMIDITGTVRDGDTNNPICNATVEIMDSVHTPVQTDFTGFYTIDNVMEGTYTFKVSASGYSTLTEDITVTQDNNVINFELYTPYLFWDFEPDDGGFTSNNPSGWQWGEPSAGGITAYSGIKVWATNLSGFYANSVHWYLDSPMIQFGNNPMLEFYQLHNFEGGSTLWDGGNVSISTNGGSSFGLLAPVGGYDGNISALGEQGYGGTRDEWTLAQFSLESYANQEIVLRWHFASDYSQHNYYGWYIDDVAIIELAGVDDPAHGNELILHQNFPNPFSGSTTITYNSTTNSHELSQIKIYNVKGQLIRKFLPVAPSPSLPVSVTWDGKDEKGKEVSAGVYFYQVQTKNYSSEIKKMLYLQK